MNDKGEEDEENCSGWLNLCPVSSTTYKFTCLKTESVP